MLPKFVARIFWESEPEIGKHDQYIVERIMDFGDTKQVRWMRQNYADTKLAEFLKKSKVLSAKSANYWSIKLAVKKELVACLSRPYQGKQNRFF